MAKSRILFPTDFSERADHALPAAIAFAEAEGGKIVFLHVAAPLNWPVPEAAKLRQDLVEASILRLRELRAKAGKRVPTEVHIAQGTPQEEIARFAARNAIDVIVIATQGHSRLERFLLGSTAERLVRAAPCSVLVTRTGKHDDPSSQRKHQRILVPTDFSEPSLVALDRATKIAQREGTELLLLHVLREADHPTRQLLAPHGFPNLWKEIRRRSQARLEALQAERLAAPNRSRVLLTEGIPSAQIADVAAANQVDLIVIGERGQTGAEGFNLGSTSERVVRVAPCSVLVVKLRQAAAG